MPLNRQFIGWTQPALPVVCGRLLQRATRNGNGNADLDDHLIVVPSGRARVRLIELLVQTCESRGLILTPPEIVTVGGLPERLYLQKKPFANDLTMRMAWVRALQSTEPALLRHLFQNLPDDPGHAAWVQMADLLNRLHVELASDVLMFPDVLKHAQKIEGFGETDRWRVLAEVQQAYLRVLDECELWDRQTARGFAIQHNECRTQKHICLVATADINQALRQMLAQTVQQSTGPLGANPVTAFVFADEQHADWFDEFGCLIPEKWLDAHVDIADSQIFVADRPPQQAEAVAGVLHQLDGRFSSDQIVIAVPQPGLEPFIQRRLEQHGVPVRVVRGAALSDSLVVRLLSAAGDYLSSGRYEQIAALLRHPAMHERIVELTGKPDFLTEVDTFQNQMLPAEVTRFVLSNDENTQLVQGIFAALIDTLQPLSGEALKLTEWQPKVEKFLGGMFKDREFDQDDDSDRRELRALRGISAMFDEFQRVPEMLLPIVSGTAVIRMLLQPLQKEFDAPLVRADEIDVIGWLDLTLDDAPVAIITGFNDGVIPSAESPDVFLPNTLRESLNLLNNSRRYARDAYALSAVLHSSEHAVLVAGRRDAEKNPMLPSRLMFAADDMTIARRAHSFFSHQVEDASGLDVDEDITAIDGDSGDGDSGAVGPESNFEVPRPEPQRVQVNEMSPTAFQNYLKCPYRFYLKRVLRSGNLAIDDRAQEMDAGDFGTVLHDVLESFGGSDFKDSTDVSEISRYFNKELDLIEQRRFQFSVRPAVRLQLKNMRLRLNRFAEKQAAWRSEGWRIEYCETDNLPYQMDVDGEPFQIIGRVDRIDIHETTGQMFVFDYKTSAQAKRPEAAHYDKGRWVNLQLPLYRHLVKSLPGGENCRLGYIVLPPTLDDIGFCEALWDAGQLEEADETARHVIRNLRAGIFWPPTDPPPDFSEEFADICMDNIFDRPPLLQPDQFIELAQLD